MHGLEKINERLEEFDQPLATESPAVPTSFGWFVSPSTAVSPWVWNVPLKQWNSLRFFFLVGCAFSLLPILNAIVDPRFNKDYRLWYAIGRLVIANKPLYELSINGEPEYMYPPTVAVLFYAPLSYFGPVVFTTVLCLSTAFAWAVCIWTARVLVAGKWYDTPRFVTLVPGLAVATYIWDVQLLGQLNLILLALTLMAFLMIRRGRPIVSGSLLGAAIAIKVFPLPAIAYFLVRRQWKAVFATLVSVIIFAWLAPGLVRGFERNTSELQQWARMMVADQSGETMAGRSSIGFSRRNQSLVSLSHRLLRHIETGDRPGKATYVNIANVSPKTAQLIGYGSCLLLGLVLLLSCRFQFGPSEQAEGLEVAMVCTLVPLCSPLAWTYFFCWLLPGWTAVEYWFDNPLLTAPARRNALYGSILSAILLASAVSEQIDPRLQAMGVTALGSTSLFLTLAYIRFNLPARNLLD